MWKNCFLSWLTERTALAREIGKTDLEYDTLTTGARNCLDGTFYVTTIWERILEECIIGQSSDIGSSHGVVGNEGGIAEFLRRQKSAKHNILMSMKAAFTYTCRNVLGWHTTVGGGG